jgi:hypothetical protein
MHISIFPLSFIQHILIVLCNQVQQYYQLYMSSKSISCQISKIQVAEQLYFMCVILRSSSNLSKQEIPTL